MKPAAFHWSLRRVAAEGCEHGCGLHRAESEASCITAMMEYGAAMRLAVETVVWPMAVGLIPKMCGAAAGIAFRTVFWQTAAAPIPKTHGTAMWIAARPSLADGCAEGVDRAITKKQDFIVNTTLPQPRSNRFSSSLHVSCCT